ncbi:MAG: hypothetical protein QW434_09580 [Pyrobaculum sp.]|nr:hypothetical protein [Pyrobaculum sp.]
MFEEYPTETDWGSVIVAWRDRVVYVSPKSGVVCLYDYRARCCVKNPHPQKSKV